MSRVYNFSAGPAVMPEEVLREAADEMLDYKGTGMSTLSVEKETIARNFENSAASQGAVLRIGSLRFFLKQS